MLADTPDVAVAGLQEGGGLDHAWGSAGGAGGAAQAVAPAAPREQAPGGGGFVPGGILVDKACARYMLMHCRGFGFDSGRKIACLVDYIHAGHFVGPRCKAVLEMTGHLR